MEMDLNELKSKILTFLEEKCQTKDVTEDSVIFDLVGTSIKFVETICELEEVLDKEIQLEEIEDITKVSVTKLTEYIV